MGTQRHYKSSGEALSTIFRAEGFRGLVRGIDAAMLRTAMGSSVGLQCLVLVIYDLPAIHRYNSLPTIGLRINLCQTRYCHRIPSGHILPVAVSQAFLL